MLFFQMEPNIGSTVEVCLFESVVDQLHCLPVPSYFPFSGLLRVFSPIGDGAPR